MNISDEAVEAAARALFDDNNPDLNAWNIPAVRDHYNHKAKTALKAAAPYLKRPTIE